MLNQDLKLKISKCLNEDLATLDKIEGRKLTFIVEAKDTHKVIGKGIHERFIINNEKFMNKLQKN